MKEGDRKVDHAVATAGKTINGWQIRSAPGDSAHYNGDWLLRAVAAKAGIYGNDAVEAMYPFTRSDGDGQTLDGSKHNYTLTFPPGQLPPVNSFWSRSNVQIGKSLRSEAKSEQACFMEAELWKRIAVVVKLHRTPPKSAGHQTGIL